MGTAASGNAGVGTIKVVTGDVKIIGVDGVARQAQVGDKVFAKETIQTNANAIVQVQLENGRMLDLGRDSKIALDDDVLNVGQGPSTAPAAAATTDIAALQAQIAAGADPSKVAEATAAGGAPGAGGTADGSGGTAVYVEQANSTGDVTSGYNTGIGGISFPTLELGVLPIINDTPIVSVSVSVQVQVQVDVGVESGTGGSGGDGGGAVQPIDFPGDTDGDGVVVSGNVANLIEGTGPGARVVNFIISLDKVFDVDVTVNYQIVPGTAQVGSDITLTNGLTGTVVIPAGQTSFIVPVNIVQDSNVESNETFSIVLTGATNATINPAASTAQAVIFDDDIQARPDTNWAKEDGVAATGNVLTGGTHSPDGRGADPSSTTDFTDQSDLNTSLATMSVTPVTINGNYGTLVLNANGSYTYTLYTEAQNAAAYATVQGLAEGEALPAESFNYTARNSLGGTSSSTLQITVYGTNDIPQIAIEGGARVSEEGAEGSSSVVNSVGNRTNPDDSPFNGLDTGAGFTDSGTLTVGDIDGDTLAVSLVAPPNGNLTSQGEDIIWSLSPDKHTLTGRIVEGETTSTIIVISISETSTNNYTYTVNLQGPVDHPDNSTEDITNFNVTVQVSDGIAAPQEALLNVVIEDDSPTISVSRLVEGSGEQFINIQPYAAVDETDLGSETGSVATLQVSGRFTAQYGADGPGTLEYALNFGDNETNEDGSLSTSLVDTATDEPVYLYQQEDGSILGVADGETVFAITMNGSEVSIELFRAVEHANPEEPVNDYRDLSGLVYVTATITDYDHDHADATIEVGSQLRIYDDGPQAVAADVTPDTLTLDESPIPGTTEDPVVNDGVNDGIRVATADYSDNFVAPDFGGDGEGSVAYAFVLTGTNVGSGLYTLGANGDPGNQIVLNQSAPGADIIGSYDGVTYFTISVDSEGIVTFTQMEGKNIWHVNTGSNDDSQTLTIDTGEGDIPNSLVLQQTVTDGDGDHDEATIDVGSGVFRIQDDGPTAAAPNATLLGTVTAAKLDESALTADGVYSATVNVSAAFGTTAAGSYGTDGAGTTVYKVVLAGGVSVGSGLYVLNPADTDPAGGLGKGTEIMLVDNGNGTVSGMAGQTVVFTISVSNSGVVTFAYANQSDPVNIWHGTNPSGDDAASLQTAVANTLLVTQTITDADGDAVTSAGLDIGTGGFFKIEDDGPTAAAPNATLLGTVTAAKLDESALTADGVYSATVNVSAAFGTTAAGSYGTDGAGTTVYKVVLAGGVSVGSGLYVLNPADTDPAGGLGKGTEIMLVDNGNGTVSGMAGQAVVFTISVSNSGVVTFAYANQSDPVNIWHGTNPSGDDAASLQTAVANTLLVTQTITDADGDAVTSAGLDIGTGGFFKIEDDGPTAAAPNATLLGTVTAAKLDESALTADGVYSATVNVSAAFGTAAAGSYGTDGAGTTVYKVVLAGGVSVGSGLYVLNPADTDPAGGLGKGTEIMLVDNGNGTVSGMAGQTVVFTISVSNSGVVTFAYANQSDPVNIWHGTNPSGDDAASLQTAVANTLLVTQTITDADGDAVTSAGLDIGTGGFFKIEDDGPTAAAPNATLLGTVTAAKLDESALTADGVYSATVNVSAAFGTTAAGSYGTDGAGTTVYKVVLAGGVSVGSGLYVLNPADTDPAGGLGKGTEIMLVDNGNGTVSGMAGQAVVFTISVSNSGVVTFAYANQSDPVNIWHGTNPSGDDAASLQTAVANTLLVTQTITDADGDTVTSAGLDIGTGGFFTIEDDGPVLGPVASIYLANEANVVGSGTLSLTGTTDGISDINVTLNNLPSGWTTISTDNIVAGQFVSTTTLVKDADGNNYGSLTVNANGTYSFTLLATAVPIPVEASLLGLTAGGPVPQVILPIVAPDGTTVVTATFTSPGTNGINSSTQGMGVDNNWVDGATTGGNAKPAETVYIHFDETLSDIGFTVGNFTTSDQLTWSVYLNGVLIDSGTATTTNSSQAADVSFVLSDFGLDANIAFDEVRVSANTGDDYRLLAMSVTTTTPPPSQALDFGVQVVDGDGDASVTQTLLVNVSGGESPFNLAGDGNANIMTGGSGNDTLSGAGGNDVLTGGAGNDILTGGFGSDTFKFTGAVAANNADTVKDFTLAPAASGGDVLNLHDVLPVAAQGQTDAGALSAYIIVDTTTSAGNTLIKVDLNGTTGGSADAVTVVTLEGVSGATLAQLLANNQIVT